MSGGVSARLQVHPARPKCLSKIRKMAASQRIGRLHCKYLIRLTDRERGSSHKKKSSVHRNALALATKLMNAVFIL